MGFTPHKAGQPSQDKELEEREYKEEKHAGYLTEKNPKIKGAYHF